MTPKIDIKQHVTDAIISSLERGTVPWQKPWVGGIPSNLVTKKPYRGINTLYLGLMNDSLYCTYKQAEEIGANVRKGQKGIPVVFYSFFEKKDNAGVKVGMIPFLRHYTVFGLSQLDNVPAKYMPSTTDRVIKHDQIESMIPAKGVQIKDDTHAYYSPKLDIIGMPVKPSFITSEGYYHTLLHEIAHWTGHADRLNRDGITRSTAPFKHGDEIYSFEELVAEIGSSFLCAEYGVNSPIDQSASYIQSWLKVLKNDKNMVMKAASQAQKVYDYIIGVKTPSTEDLEG